MAPTAATTRLSAEEIRNGLADFARRWSLYGGSERSEAQTFLNELFACYGTNRREVATFEEPQEGRFLDLIWERVCLIEMKRPSEAGRLARHREQAFAYWRGAAHPERSLPAPRYVVLCGFHRFEVWEPGAYPNAPRVDFELRDLPDQADALAFLHGRDPFFTGTQGAITQEAVRLLTDLYHQVRDRGGAGPDELRDFFFQAVWSMFAEDLGQLPGHLFSRMVAELIEDPRRSSADELGTLFTWLSSTRERPPGGLFTDTPYVNGRLFDEPARVHLERDELVNLALACEYDWKRVEPTIFGALMQGVLGREAQWELGAHYTHEVDIRKIVEPSVVRPWRERIENATTVRQTEQLQSELLGYVVLDPACGSGNFLYVAYRELRRLEQQLRERQAALRRARGMAHTEQEALAAFFSLTNMRGIELDATAVAIARMTLWMGHKLAVDELGLSEATLPLEDLSGIVVGDALRLGWPRASVIIGNPPFHGDRRLRRLFGADYVRWLQREFNCGLKDYCVYWFRKAHDALDDGERAGLVGTNSISQNRARDASLNYIVKQGGVIVDAVSTQDWPGEANVDVSLVNWIKDPDHPPEQYILDGEPVEAIDTALVESTIPIADVPAISRQTNIAFQGFLPGAKYDIPPTVAEKLLARTEARYRTVVKPYLGTRDITRTIDQTPSRWTIDFAQLSLEAATRFPAALDIVRNQAKTAREESTSYERNPRWWQFLWPRPEFRRAIEPLGRFIAGTATAKRIFFVWCEKDWRPSNSTNMIALESDYAMAVLTSRVHTEWAAKKSSTLEDRIRYTPTSAFDTFPWPQRSDLRDEIAGIGKAIIDRRETLCREHERGLGWVYDRLDEGAFDALRALHRQLDQTVWASYGLPVDALDDTRERNARLYELNAEIVGGGSPEYESF